MNAGESGWRVKQRRRYRVVREQRMAKHHHDTLEVLAADVREAFTHVTEAIQQRDQQMQAIQVAVEWSAASPDKLADIVCREMATRIARL